MRSNKRSSIVNGKSKISGGLRRNPYYGKPEQQSLGCPFFSFHNNGASAWTCPFLIVLRRIHHQHLKSITNVPPTLEASGLPRRVDLRGAGGIRGCLRIP